MFAYFNELSADGCINEKDLEKVINTLIECLKALSEKKVSGINLDKKIGLYQLTQTIFFQKILYDDTIIDHEKKALILGMMTTIENPMEELEKEYFMEATCRGKKCIGLGLASEKINNTFSISLSNAGWDESVYKIELKQLTENEEKEISEQTIETTCRNVSVTSHIDGIEDLFTTAIPSTGLDLFLQLGELFPNLIFSPKAKEQIKKNHDRPAIEQIYYRLKDINNAATKLSGIGLRKELFQYKASPEHEQRRKLPEMDIMFDDGKTRNCEWHLRYTPGGGRIHFSTDESDGKTIYIGHVDGKIGIS